MQLPSVLCGFVTINEQLIITFSICEAHQHSDEQYFQQLPEESWQPVFNIEKKLQSYKNLEQQPDTVEHPCFQRLQLRPRSHLHL